MSPTVMAGAAPLPSAAAFAPDCPYFVNKRLGARVPGDLDLCQAWKVRTPAYPLDPFPTTFASCKAFVADTEFLLGNTLPKPAQLRTNLLPTVSPPVRQGDKFISTVSFGLPVGAQIFIQQPTWPEMTDLQRTKLDAFFKLITLHERGHQNILGNLSRKYSGTVESPVSDGLGAARRRAATAASNAQTQLVAADELIDALLYDSLTEHGRRQSVLGGTDASLARLCDDELPITSTFDFDDEGWTAGGDAQTATPQYVQSGGNPGGFVQIKDQAVGGIWFWIAPGKFSGDLEHAYGRKLTFDLKQSRLDRQFDSVDVRLEGGAAALTMKFGLPPGLDWTGYVVPLSVGGGWMTAANTPATEQQIRNVLGDLNLLLIRGEYRTGSDTGGLDNVLFGVP